MTEARGHVALRGLEPLAWRTRIGLVVVSSSTVTEGRFRKVAPDVGFFAARVLLRGAGRDAFEEMEASADRAFEELASIPVDAVAYCCTLSGAHLGPAGDRAFCADATNRWDVPVISTMMAVTDALRVLEVSRVTVVSPYREAAHEAERGYLEQAGIEPVVMRGMDLDTAEQMAAVTPDEIIRLCVESWDDASDGLFISCMNFDGMAAAETLEAVLGKPVVTSHSATLWATLHAAASPEPLEGYGKLLTTMPPAASVRPS